MFTAGFDNDKYLKLQSQKIKERISLFGEKLYLEFGGKLFDDFHASRVLPGFAPDSKVRMLIEIKDEAEIVIAINSADIEKNKQRSDLGIKAVLAVGGAGAAAGVIGAVVGYIRRKKTGRKQTWYRSM